MGEMILIVEDNVEMQELLKLLLEQEGYDVLSAVSGSDAIKKLRNHPKLMLILLDLTLPDMTSDVFLKMLGTDHLAEKVPIVFFSAIPNLKQMSLPPGVVGVMQKPFQIHELIELIDSFKEKTRIFPIKKKPGLLENINTVR